LECPNFPDEDSDPDEAAAAVTSARNIIDAAQRLLASLGML
jgi:hypothetical protein